MPRQSSEAKAASIWRVGGTPPAPPPRLKGRARALWIAIAGEHPADRFVVAAQVMLAQYCALAVEAERVGRALDQLDVTAPEYANLLKSSVKIAASLCSLSVKLRLAPSSVYQPQDRRLTERTSGTDDPLLGGFATRQAS